MFWKRSTYEISNSQTPERAISLLEYVKLNGVKQRISIRSHDVNLPVLLFLHGGPGIPENPLLRFYNSELERHFVMVHWEQRGTGKSEAGKRKDFTIDQFVKDAYGLVIYLKKRFQHEKIFLMAHSWGTLLGLKMVREHPDDFHSYSGIGQMVEPMKAEKMSFKYTLRKAKELKNQSAVKELHAVNHPSFLSTENNKKWTIQLKNQRKWLVRFGGIIHDKKMLRKIWALYLRAPEFSMKDLAMLSFYAGISVKRLWPEVMKVNFFNEPKEFQIPIFFFQGVYDYNCPSELVHSYFEKIKAPVKELYYFENSAHAPHYEEYYQFNKTMIKIQKKIFQLAY